MAINLNEAFKTEQEATVSRDNSFKAIAEAVVNHYGDFYTDDETAVLLINVLNVVRNGGNVQAVKNLFKPDEKCSWQVSTEKVEGIYPIYNTLFTKNGANRIANSKANKYLKDKLKTVSGFKEVRTSKGYIIWGFTKKSEADKAVELLGTQYFSNVQ